MISKTMTVELNKQINKELYSAYLYQAMANHLEYKSFPGMANWLNVQAREEMAHAERFRKYIQDQNEQAILEAMEKPASTFKSPLEIFEKAVEHEKFITASIYKLVELANKENDYATLEMLQWFVKEQVEEEKNPSDILAKLKMIGEGHNGALLYIDKELKKRE